jgi:hypothetical protein
MTTTHVPTTTRLKSPVHGGGAPACGSGAVPPAAQSVHGEEEEESKTAKQTYFTQHLFPFPMPKIAFSRTNAPLHRRPFTPP